MKHVWRIFAALALLTVLSSANAALLSRLSGQAYCQTYSPRSGVFYYGWAVRPGDIAPVPVPAAAWLFGSALGLLGWIRRRSISRSNFPM